MNRRGFLQFLGAAPAAVAAVPASPIMASVANCHFPAGHELITSQIQNANGGKDISLIVREITDQNIATGRHDRAIREAQRKS